jgi:hypothetical protein
MCQRRMAGKANPGRAPGKEYYYYTCPHNPANPRELKHQGHVRAAIRERVIHAAVTQIITGLLSADRADMLAAILPSTAGGHDQRNHARAQGLQRQINQNQTAQHGLITQLERLGNDATPAADAMRQLSPTNSPPATTKPKPSRPSSTRSKPPTPPRRRPASALPDPTRYADATAENAVTPDAPSVANQVRNQVPSFAARDQSNEQACHVNYALCRRLPALPCSLKATRRK